MSEVQVPNANMGNPAVSISIEEVGLNRALPALASTGNVSAGQAGVRGTGGLAAEHALPPWQGCNKQTVTAQKLLWLAAPLTEDGARGKEDDEPLHSPEAQMSCPNSLASQWPILIRQISMHRLPKMDLFKCNKEGPLPQL